VQMVGSPIFEIPPTAQAATGREELFTVSGGIATFGRRVTVRPPAPEETPYDRALRVASQWEKG